MSYVIDPRKNWQLVEKTLADETDPRRRQILRTLVEHSQAEAKPDFDALMATVSPRAHYHSYSTPDPAHSPKGKDGVEAYYRGIVEAKVHRIEHDVERVAAGRDVVTTEGRIRIAYPGGILAAMGTPVPDPDGLYLYQQRLLIVWEFDEDGLVLCEDSYGGVGSGDGFEGIAERPIAPEQIYDVGRQGL